MVTHMKDVWYGVEDNEERFFLLSCNHGYSEMRQQVKEFNFGGFVLHGVGWMVSDEITDKFEKNKIELYLMLVLVWLKCFFVFSQVQADWASGFILVS